MVLFVAMKRGAILKSLSLPLSRSLANPERVMDLRAVADALDSKENAAAAEEELSAKAAGRCNLLCAYLSMISRD